MYGFVYVTTNLVNGKRYIGQRMCRPGGDSYLGSGKTLKAAVRKYGRDAFHRTILQRCESAITLDLAERAWIAQEHAVDSGDYYNITAGGEGSNGLTHSPESRAKMSAAHTGKRMSAESRAKMSAFRTGRVAHNRGKSHSPETRAKMSAAHTGKRMSPESRAKMSQRQTGVERSATTKAKISAAKSIPVACTQTGQRFDSIKSAAFIMGLNRGNLAAHVRGERGSVGGLTFVKV